MESARFLFFCFFIEDSEVKESPNSSFYSWHLKKHLMPTRNMFPIYGSLNKLQEKTHHAFSNDCIFLIPIILQQFYAINADT